MEELKQSIARLEKRLHDQENHRAELAKKEPFCWQEFLENADEVAVRQATLQQQIKALEEVLGEYEALWNQREVA